MLSSIDEKAPNVDFLDSSDDAPRRLDTNDDHPAHEFVSPQTTGLSNLHDHAISPLSGITPTYPEDSNRENTSPPVDSTPILTDQAKADQAYQGIEVVQSPYQDQQSKQAKMEGEQPQLVDNYEAEKNATEPPKNAYAVSMPLRCLQQGPGPVDCPICKVREVTRTEYVSGNYTHAASAIFCFCLCLGCIPYMASVFKDVEHYCGNCNSLLAVWHRTGRTDVVAHGAV